MLKINTYLFKVNIYLTLLLLVATIIFLVKNKKTESILMFVGQLIKFLTIIIYQILNAFHVTSIFYNVNGWLSTIAMLIFIAGVFVLAFNTAVKPDLAEENYNKRVQNNKIDEGNEFITKKSDF